MKPTNLKICLIGMGRWGQNHFNTLLKLELLSAVVDPCLSASALSAWQKSGVPLYESLDQIELEKFDGFVVATPAETHFEIASRLLSAKKAVLVEKPLARSRAEAEELDRISKKNNTVLMVGHILLFHPAIQKMKELVSAGKVGKLQYLYSNRLNFGTVRTEEDILWSFAPHDISLFQEFIGKKPLSVTSKGGMFIQPHIHDTTLTFIKYPSNITGHIFVSWLHPFKEHRLVLIGNKGMLQFEDSGDSKGLYFYDKCVDFINGSPRSRDGLKEQIEFDQTPPLEIELAAFARAIQTGVVERSDGKSGVEVLEILEQASDSLLENDSKSAPRSSFAQSFIHESSFVDENVTIGVGTKVWHFSHIQSGAVIGANCTIGQNVNIGNNVRIGNNVKIQNNVSIFEGVELEDYVFCGPSATFTNVLYPRSKYPQNGNYLKTKVGYGATIGANATIVCGHSIGKYAFVAAGAVVARDVADYCLVAGVPAKAIGWVCECGKNLGSVSTGEGVTCECSKCYQLKDGALSLLN